MKNSTDGVKRILDANINRAKEGLRVCEEITRFILDSRSLTAGFKRARHEFNDIIETLGDKKALLAHRESRRDVGRTLTLKSEIKRIDYRDIFFANIQRVKESVRVLEEFTKLLDTGAAMRFKKIRYTIYEIEKGFAEKIVSVRHNR